MKFMLMIAAILLIAGVAIADKPELEKRIAQFPYATRADEVEPNDDCTTANALTVGDPMNGAIVAGEQDWFEVNLLTGDCFSFETHAGDIGDTKLYVYDTDCVTELEYNDDGGEGYYSLIEFTAPADGAYYVVVTGYGATTAGTYILTMDACPEPPNCDDAIDLVVQGLGQFTIDLCAQPSVWTGEYGDCTGYADNGNEAVYKIYLLTGDHFFVTEDGTHDMSMYLVTDCADIIGSCVAGSDNCCSGAQEIIDYTAAADGWYYLFVDGYSGCSEVTVTIDNPIPRDDATWGSVKSLYR